MLTNRIIPCLDIKDGKIVKGIRFQHLKEAGDPVKFAMFYAKEGADEIIFLDIKATQENRKTLVSLVHKIAHYLCIPFTIGGGITSLDDVERLLNAGADKISVNTEAVKRPKFINDLVERFGSQCVVLSIDIQINQNEWWVYINGGRIKTSYKALDWAKEAVERGVGEIILTSINNDGTKKGFSIGITRTFSEKLSVPIIASGGAGNMEDFYEVFKYGKADAAISASVFHSKEIEIPILKYYLSSNKIFLR